MTKLTRSLVAAVGALAALALISVGATAIGATSKGRPDSGVLYVAITHTVGSTEYLAGDATDKIHGSGAVTYTATVGTGSKPGTLKVTVNPVTAFFKDGSLSGKGSATLIVSNNGTVTFTNGKINETHGAGGEKGHSFVATFTGTGKSATGPFVFDFKGTYK